MSRKMLLHLAVGLIAVLSGAAAILAGAYLTAIEAHRFDWAIVLIGVGASLSAAGLVILTEWLFVHIPQDRADTSLTKLLRDLRADVANVLISRLPEAVASIHLRVDTTPSFNSIFQDCRHVTFFGPEGSTILSHLADIAVSRDRKHGIQVDMYVPMDKAHVGKNIDRTDFISDSPDWLNAFRKAENVTRRFRTLNVTIHRVNLVPTVSALQVDDSYYQVTMLFPVIANDKRPTFVLKSDVADREYFAPLWASLTVEAARNASTTQIAAPKVRGQNG
jgi:hypothetical protein